MSSICRPERDRAIGPKGRKHIVVTHVLGPGLVIFGRAAMDACKFRDRVAHAMRRKGRETGIGECSFEDLRSA